MLERYQRYLFLYRKKNGEPTEPPFRPSCGKPVKRKVRFFMRSKNTKCISIKSTSFDDMHTLRLMAKRATVKKPPLDFGGETLGQRLTRLRKERGFTQVELAAKVGITQVLISAYETDRCAFSVEMAVRFSIALGISTDALLHPQAAKKRASVPSRKVLRRLEQIESLPRRKQDALLTTIDAFLDSAAG